MKFALALLFSTSLLLLSSCDEKQINLPTEQTEQGKDPILPAGYRLPTEEELRVLVEKGIIPEDFTRSLNCEWSDGQFGSVNCDGGTCRILFYTSEDPKRMCLACEINNVYTNEGACRPDVQ